ncbi:MAG: hypothetical protein LBH10_04650 [Burkholderiaceae bacterium]|nr:hypothetical protein [Burkholderiaceae bacterium]
MFAHIFYKVKTGIFIHVLILASIGVGAMFLPALGSAQDVHAWQQAIKNVSPSQPGCFQATYPNTQWQQVPCAQPQSQGFITSVPPQAESGRMNTESIGNAVDYSAIVQGNGISSVEGSFINATGVSSVASVDSNGNNPQNNVFSLQLNTNLFSAANSGLCSNSNSTCLGWVQFIYNNDDSAGIIHIQYWIVGVNSCPSSSWSSALPIGCYIDSSLTSSGTTPGIQAKNIGAVTLNGQTSNGWDTAILNVGGQAYSVVNQSVFGNLSQYWKQSEFNIFGYSTSYPILNFNSGSSLTVRTRVDNGTTNTPTCSSTGTTGESSNLNFNSPCCPYGGGEPSIAFVEGTATGQTTTCAALGNNTITPSAGSNGTISPAVALQVPNGAVSTFTVTPNTGYQIASVSGCGGSLSGNIYTTAAATSNCTVTAAFTVVNPTVTLTRITPSGSSSPAVGAAVSVSSGATTTFTITPPAGATSASWAGLTSGCGSIGLASTWYIGQNLTLQVGPVTSTCTFPLAFTISNPTVTLTQITPNGSSSPAVGTAVSVTAGATTTFTITPPAGATNASWAGLTSGCGSIGLASTWYVGGNLTLKVGPVTGTCTFPVAFSY